ncbi:hypothetical protein F511_27240 [Dorcoceras hygrometricum]|uniref:Uncharacterized protein n=1 Tax=Dorcoceras hygrometricum TaxID=472368 RepID=A0A2Z7BJT7_9LAMI|nr:hypothetical protein F511_27240 [Dorcoceras hygrometricum]
MGLGFPIPNFIVALLGSAPVKTRKFSSWKYRKKSDLGRSTHIWDRQLRFGTVNSDLGQSTVNSDLEQSTANSNLDSQQSTQIWTVSSELRSGQSTVNSDMDSQQSTQIWTVGSQLRCGKEMAPSVPRTRAAAVLRMKQIALDDQSRMIRRLRAKLATERRDSAAIKKEHESNQAKKQQARESHMECHHKMQARIQEAEDTIQDQHLVIEALVEEKASLLQTIQGLQEDNGAPDPFDDEWEEEPEEDPEEEGLEDFPLGEGEIVEE